VVCGNYEQNTVGHDPNNASANPAVEHIRWSVRTVLPAIRARQDLSLTSRRHSSMPKWTMTQCLSSLQRCCSGKAFFSDGLFELPECEPRSQLSCYLDWLRHGYSGCWGRSGRRLRPAGASTWSKASRGGPSWISDCNGCIHGPPNAVLATACCTATDSVLHQRLAHALEAAARRAGGAR